MSCFKNNCYLPQPPRAWSRVQNSCSLITDSDNNSLVRDPYTGQLVPPVVLGERIAMLNKGNVLQYKANSSNLTRAQKYSKIAKGQWVNRNTTWATQSTRGYTNPNTTSLKRSGNVVNIAIDPITGAVIGPTTEPQTCPKPFTPTNEALPSNGGGGSSVDEPPPIPPPVPPTPGSETFPDIIADTPLEPIVIQDGGILICSIQEDPCTGESKSSLAQQLCHPTTDSDVPGPIQELCWNDGTQTWYPRSRYVMTNSANKWPVNAELFSSVIIYAPYITSVTSERDIVTITWIFNNGCLPATNFNIYQNGILIKSVDGNTFTTQVIIESCIVYQYFIVAENITGKAISEPSNIVEFNYLDPPSNLMYTTVGSGSINLTWDAPTEFCGTVSYNIYKNGIYIDNTSNLQYTVNNLINCVSVTFSVSSIDSTGNQSPKNNINVIPYWPNPPSTLTATATASQTIQLNWTPPSPNCSEAVSYNIYVDNVYNTNVLAPSTTATINGLINCNMYDFSVSSLNSIAQESSKITITDITLLWPNPPTLLGYTWSPTNVTIITLNLSAPNPNCSPPTSYTLYYSTDNITFNTITGITPSPSYNFNPTSYSTYYFKMTSVNGSGESTFSSTLTANITLFTFSGGSFVTSSQTTGSTTIYNTVIQAGTTTLNFNVLPDSSYCNFLLVGAGGGGGGCWDNPVYPYFDIYSGAGGGGGGNLLVNNFSVSQSTYTILVGTGGAGGEFNTSSAGVATPGQPGGNTSITGPGITNCISYGGDGGDQGQDGNRADGGTGGTVLVNLLSGISTPLSGSTTNTGGNGGQGNAGGPGTYTSGQGGTNGYFYSNQSISGFSYPPSFGYPTYYSLSTTFGFPPVTYYLYTPSSVTLTEWYQVSGGGGGANSNTSTTLAAWQGAGGTGSGGLSGFYYDLQVPSISNPSQTPYSSFGGGGGGGGILTFGMDGGDGLAVIWFNYTFP